MRGRREASQKVLAGQQPVPFANEDQLGPLVLPLSARSREASTELKVQLQKQRFLTNQDLMRLAGQDGVPGSPGLSILLSIHLSSLAHSPLSIHRERWQRRWGWGEGEGEQGAGEEEAPPHLFIMRDLALLVNSGGSGGSPSFGTHQARELPYQLQDLGVYFSLLVLQIYNKLRKKAQPPPLFFSSWPLTLFQQCLGFPQSYQVLI